MSITLGTKPTRGLCSISGCTGYAEVADVNRTECDKEDGTVAAEVVVGGSRCKVWEPARPRLLSQVYG